jgi:AcrR family transcriptional regulator
MNKQANEPDTTAAHILNIALHLYLTQGIKKVTMADVAEAAGITRVTVYRHYANKQVLVQAVFQHIADGFEQARQQVEHTPDVEIEAIVDMIGASLASLPPCDFPARLDELARSYPTIARRFRESRLSALTVIFERLFALAEAQGRLRPGLSRQVVQTYFMETVVNVVESPRLLALGLSPNDIFQTVKSIFLYRVLKG